MLTPQEIAQLKAPFPLDAHTVREGFRNKSKTQIRWFVYIERSDVQDLLEKVFPGEWSTPEPKAYLLGSTVSATVGITVRGITRWDGGDDDTGEGVKSALTNGFRRAAAYGWGVARYCYDMDFQIWTDSYPDGDYKAMEVRRKEAFDKFAGWYKRQFGNAPKAPPAPTGNPASTPAAMPTVENAESAKKPLETANNAKSPIDGLSVDETDAWFAKLDPTWNTIKGKLLKDVWSQFWTIVTAMKIYDHPNHMRASVTKLQNEGKLFPAQHTLRQAILIVLGHKEAKYGDGQAPNESKLETDELKKAV